jgi:hypothetical protein
MEEQMVRRCLVLIGLAAMVTISACTAGNLSRLEMDYGASSKLARFNQILNPEAGKNLEPVSGLDGQAAQATMEKYRKGFEKPEKEPAYMFSIGGKK